MITMNIAEIIAYKFYIPWSNLKGEFSQIRKTWVKKVMRKYCEIGLAKKDAKIEGKYKIMREKKIKNVQNYMIKKLCNQTIKEKSKFKIFDLEEDTKQKALDSFA